MSFLVLKKNKFFEYLETIKSEKLGVYISFFFHFSILLFLIGLPDFFETRSINIPTIIPIEIINVADTTSISKNVTKKKIEQKKEKVIKEKKFSSSKNQEIKRITIKDKPDIENEETKKNLISKNDFTIREKITAPVEQEKKKIIVNEKKIESLKAKKIKLKPKPKAKPLVDNSKLNKKATPKVKPIQAPDKVKPIQAPETDSNIASLLKDLRNDQVNPKVENKKISEKEKIQKIDKLKEKVIEESANLSISEIDLVLQQLSRCFIAPLGSEIEKTTFVKISAKIQQNRRVIQNSIRIVDTNIDISNPFYGPLTRSSMNTFLNPDCIPLKLPEEKYDVWKNITLTFDYSIMRGN